MTTRADLLVLGAGPAGLGAAYRAARAGRRVVVLERANRVGGLASSFDIAGVRVDHGSHRLHPSTHPDILAELRSLLGDDLQLRHRNGRIRLEGRWIAFPLRTGDLLRRLPSSFALGVARDTVLGWARRPRGDTFAAELQAGLGPTICERFYFPYARKLWGLEPEEISGEQARRRVRSSSVAKILRRVVGRTEGRHFYYPRRGFGQLWERLAEGATDAGAEIRLGSTVEELELGSDGWSAGTADGDLVSSERVWSTVPLTALVRMVRPGPPAAVNEAADALRFRSMVLVYLVVPRAAYTPYDAHYLPGPETPISRLTEPKNYRDGDDPTDRTVLCAEIPCEAGDATWHATQDELAELVAEGLRRSELPAPGAVDVEVRRLPRVYPVYRAGFEPAFDAVDRWVTGLPGLLSFGRLGLFAHDNSHHALAMAWAAADAMGPGGFDAGAWDHARRAFAEHVVED